MLHSPAAQPSPSLLSTARHPLGDRKTAVPQMEGAEPIPLCRPDSHLWLCISCPGLGIAEGCWVAPRDQAMGRTWVCQGSWQPSLRYQMQKAAQRVLQEGVLGLQIPACSALARLLKECCMLEAVVP